MERIDLQMWTLWLDHRSDGWWYALTPHDVIPTREQTYWWKCTFHEGEGMGGFNTRWEAIADSEWRWDIPF